MTEETILVLAGVTREQLGRQVRREWEAWAREQPDVADHPAWTRPWHALDERDREADRRIGVALFRAGWLAGHSLHGGLPSSGRPERS